MRRTCVGWAAWIAALVVAVLAGSAPARATAVVGQPLRLCVARAAPGDTPAARFTATTGFDCTTRQTDFGRGSYWVRSQQLNRAGPVAVRSGSLWQQRATIHALYADGAIVARTMDQHGATRAIQLGAMFEQDFPARAAPLVRLLWHVEGAANMRGIVIAARVATPDESARANLVLGALYGAFGGLAFALLIYNLALWGALRHGFQLAYCAMLVALLCYAFSSSGLLAWAWPGIANNDRLRINAVGLALSAIGALCFARRFFEPHVFYGRLNRIVYGVIGLLVVGATLYATAPDAWIRPADRLYSLTFAPLSLVSIPILWQAWRRRSNFLWLFAVAWGVPIVFAAARVASNLQLIGWSFLLDNSTLVAMTIEATLSSLAIAYRFRMLSRERDDALEKEIAARLLADTDPLTGLHNRRAFLRNAIGRGGTQQLIVADIDHFKAVNETIGHDGGDEVLRLVARVLRAVSPPGTLVARIGGEEFALLSDPARALPADELLAAIRAQRMPFDLAITCSLGLSSGPLTSEADWKRLYRDADQALFAAKAAGRDRARSAVAA